MFVNKNNIKKIEAIRRAYKIKYPIKNEYHPVVPSFIYQTWHSKKVPLGMHNNIVRLKRNNPGFKYFLFDDNDCENFIRDNFEPDVVDAYQRLVPGAYKADLWRYCILYKQGGIYLDIKYGHANGFKLITLLEKEHWVLDIGGDGIYNALMVCKPGNEILWKAIQKVVDNVKNRYYGPSCLYPTGPGLLSEFFTQEEKQRMDMKHRYFFDMSNRVILLNNIIVFRQYPGYMDEHYKYKKTEHYAGLWDKRQIYR